MSRPAISREKKTIAYIGGFELPNRNAAAHRVLANGKLFRELGYDVVYLGVHKGAAGGELVREETHGGFKSFSVPYPRSRREWIARLCSRGPITRLLNDTYHGQIAAVICYNHPAVSQWRIRRLCKRHNVKFMADVTEWYESSGGALVFRAAKWLDTTLRMRVVHRFADALITTSSAITAFYRAKTNVPIVELPTLYDQQEMGSRARPQVDPGQPSRWIYAGSPFTHIDRLDKAGKNIKDRVDAVVELACRLNADGVPVAVKLFGLTREEYLRAFPAHGEMITEYGAMIDFRGVQSHADVLRDLLGSDFSIFFRRPTRLTLSGFPSKLAESVTCGVPVITNYLENLASYRDRVPGLFLVDFENMKECVAKTKSIVNTPKDRMAELRGALLSGRPFDFHTYKGEVSNFLNLALS